MMAEITTSSNTNFLISEAIIFITFMIEYT